MNTVAPTRKPRILVVDDDELVATTTSMILDQSGFVSQPTFSAQEALTHAQSAQFDVLLTDVMMEPTNGIQLAIAFRALNPSASIVLFSGNEQAAELLRDAARDGHEFPILAKPVHPGDLIEWLHRVGTKTRPESTSLQQAAD